MKVIIAGGRDFNDYAKLKLELDFAFSNLDKRNITIVSGKARGADSLGEKYANEMNYNIKEFPADWDKYNKGAGPIRNCQMSNYADSLIAFWDGSSKGTKHMINQAKKKELQVRIVKY